MTYKVRPSEGLPVPSLATRGASATAVNLAAETAARIAADTALDSDKQDISEKGVTSGYAGLDGGGTVPLAQLPAYPIVGGVSYRGLWNATTNSPTIPAASSGNRGFFYEVSVAGTTTIDGISTWAVGDHIVSNGATWEKLTGQGLSDADSITITGQKHIVRRNLGDLGAVEGDNDANISANHTALDAAIATGKIYTLNPGSLYKIGRGRSLLSNTGFEVLGSGQAEILMGTDAGQFDAADLSVVLTDASRYAFYAASGVLNPILDGLLFRMEANASARTCFPVRYSGVTDGVMSRLTATGFKENDGGLFRVDSIIRGLFERITAIDCTHNNNAFLTQVTAFCVDGDRANLAVNPGFSSDTVWTKGAGWSISAGKATHAAASGTAALSQNVGLVSGIYYTISLTISGRTVGSINVKAGDTDGGLTFSANGSYTEIDLVSGNAVFSIIPTSDFDGSIDDVAVQRNSRAWSVRDLRAINLRQGAAARAVHNDQSDCLNVQTLGDVCGARAYDIYGEDVGELIDCFGSGLLIVGFTGKNITETPVKLVYGAQNNRFLGGKINGTGLSAVYIVSAPASAVGATNKPVSNNRVDIDCDNVGLIWSTYQDPIGQGMHAGIQVEASDDSNKPFNNHITGRIDGDLAGTMETVFKEQRGTGIMAKPNRVEVAFANNSDIAAIASFGKLGIFRDLSKRVQTNGTIPTITAASVINVTADDVETINVTGATTVSFIDASVSDSFLWTGPVRKRLRILTGFTFVDGAQLICPGGVNLVAAAGSKVDVEEIAFGVWEIMNYQT